MDKKKLQQMMTEMAAVGAKYGFSVTPNGGSMEANSAKIKFLVRSVSVDASGKTVIEATSKAKSAGAMRGIDITKPVLYKGASYRIIDYRPRAQKYPWVMQGPDGKQICFSHSLVLMGQAVQAKPAIAKQDGLAHLA